MAAAVGAQPRLERQGTAKTGFLGATLTELAFQRDHDHHPTRRDVAGLLIGNSSSLAGAQWYSFRNRHI
jgi:hypothetical protein